MTITRDIIRVFYHTIMAVCSTVYIHLYCGSQKTESIIKLAHVHHILDKFSFNLDLGSIPGLATYFRFSFRFFKKGSCQVLAKVCARSTG